MSPWRSEDVLRWTAATALGAAMCVVAWYLASRDSLWSSQVGPANLAVAGVVVAGYAQVVWLLRGRRAVGARARRLLVDADPGGHGLTLSRTGGGATDGGAALLVAGAGLSYFHRHDCPLAAGRGWAAATQVEHRAEGRAPCGVCRPLDKPGASNGQRPEPWPMRAPP